QHALAATTQPARTRARVGQRVQAPRYALPDLLLHVPPMNTRQDLSPELAALQDRLGPGQGKTYWRSLEELADTPAFQELMRRESPGRAAGGRRPLSRRRFLTLRGAPLALAGLGGCSVRPAPSVNLVPYVRAPEEIVPGRPFFYATAMTLGGAAVGLLV